MAKPGLISRYFDIASPGKGTAARKLIAGQLRGARRTLGRKKVHGNLVKEIKKDVRTAKTAPTPDRLRRLKKTSHKMTISPGIKAKRVSGLAKPKSVMAGAGAKRVRSRRIATALKTHSTSTGGRMAAARHTHSYMT
jgi:hypothetical protein